MRWIVATLVFGLISGLPWAFIGPKTDSWRVTLLVIGTIAGEQAYQRIRRGKKMLDMEFIAALSRSHAELLTAAKGVLEDPGEGENLGALQEAVSKAETLLKRGE